MFSRLVKGGSHRQRLEMHSAMMEASQASQPSHQPSSHSPCPSPMSVGPETPAAAAGRRRSIQVDQLERPPHRQNAARSPSAYRGGYPGYPSYPSAYTSRDVFNQAPAPQGPTAAEQVPVGTPAAYGAAPSGAAPPSAASPAAGAGATPDWACLYLPHNDPSRRRRSIDCIRSARRSDRSAAAAAHADAAMMADDSDSVCARSQIRRVGDGAGGSDSEEEVCSNKRNTSNNGGHGGGRNGQRRNSFAGEAVVAPGHHLPRNVFACGGEENIAAATPTAPDAGPFAAGNASRAERMADFWGGPPAAYGDAMAVEGGEAMGGAMDGGWVCAEHALHPAGLMQARAAMMAQCQGAVGRADRAGAVAPGGVMAAQMSCPWQ